MVLQVNRKIYIKNTSYAYDARCVGSIQTIDANGKFSQKNKGGENKIKLSDEYTLPTNWSSNDTGCLEEDMNYESDRSSSQGLYVNFFNYIRYYFIRVLYSALNENIPISI